MKKVDKKTFMKLKEGTVFYKKIKSNPDTLMFDSLCIKGETLSNDFYYIDTSDPLINFNGNSDFIDVWIEHLEKNDNVKVDYDSFLRDGMYDDDDEFFVLDKEDVKSLLRVINQYSKIYGI